jgi:beta-mannanase
MLIQRLETVGIDVQLHVNKYKLLYLLPDIAELILTDIKDDLSKAGLYKQEYKHQVKPILDKLKKLNATIYKDIIGKDENVAVTFGDLSDELYQLMLISVNKSIND